MPELTLFFKQCNIWGIAIYDLNKLNFKKIKHDIDIFLLAQIKIIQFFDILNIFFLDKVFHIKFFIWILFYWGFRESFLIIIKLGRWSIILFTKFPLKMVLSYVMTKTLSTKDVLLWLMIPIGLLIHGCTKKMT